MKTVKIVFKKTLNEGCTDVGWLYEWRSSFCLGCGVNGYLIIHMMLYWPGVFTSQHVILNWDVLGMDHIFDHGFKEDGEAEGVSLQGTPGCVFLQCTEWYLYKYYKKIILSLEDVRP